MDNLTRAVIVDLWPLYISGDVCQDTRRFVEDFLSRYPEFARELERSGDALPACSPPSLPPDHELKTLARLKRRMTGPIWLMQLAILFSCFAFGRIVSDTSFDVSPRNFIITASIAACLWVAFLVRLLRGRRSVLVRLR
jgi:hypothetical protein